MFLPVECRERSRVRPTQRNPLALPTLARTNPFLKTGEIFKNIVEGQKLQMARRKIGKGQAFSVIAMLEINDVCAESFSPRNGVVIEKISIGRVAFAANMEKN